MKAIRIHVFGNASVLSYEGAPVPEPGPDEVLVRVIASAVNPIEWKIRSGAMKQALGRDLPVTLGWDCAGVVERAAPETGFAPGDAVYSYPAFGAGGTHAEYVAIRADQVARKPATASFADAAALPMTGGAAWRCVVAAGAVSEGQRVLILGASGGVGTLAIQLAKARGAHVFATASAAGLDLVAALGADVALDRATPLETVARDLDLVIDLAGGETQARSWDLLHPGGLLLSTPPPPPPPPPPKRAQAAGVRATFVFTPPSGAILTELAALVDAMKLRPVVGLELALRNARRAHEAGEAGRVRGKIVLHVGAP